MSATMTSYVVDTLWQLTNCFNCFPSTPALKINGRSYKILRLLGEGGFSYVYLVQSPPSPNLYALKKIRCPFGAESVALALKEVEAYSLFQPHPNIIHALDHAVIPDRSDPSAKTVYILLPYYRRGNLQDAINANLVNGAKFPERRLMVLFRGVCVALQAMHNYKVGGAPGGKNAQSKAKRVRADAARADRGEDHGDDDDGLGDAEPLMEGNIMISDNGQSPILMDLGSLAPSPTPITSRALALQVQDTAAEHSTMPYRAPELFDVKTGSTIDTKVDIWSLGCTLYACLVGKSPFEARSEETGGSLSLCVLGGDWRFPDEHNAQANKSRGKQKMPTNSDSAPAQDAAVSEMVKDVVRRCLMVEPSERPDVNELLTMVDDVIAALPEDGDSLEE
ncbi:kinase-like protein [Aureobasidium pullulans]|uniref:non-specific serine/threonine protein kinase n=1 Tax=Aureobasidium pullulans TaxID=5580 RepID=A0AB74IZ99_AURPU|nr:kinase-like protein [Aureobasidium pullulans]